MLEQVTDSPEKKDSVQEYLFEIEQAFNRLLQRLIQQVQEKNCSFTTGAISPSREVQWRNAVPLLVSVESSGAKGDGVTDDTTAIQTTINFVNEIGGGTVFLPIGNYLITTPLLMKENVTLMGVGRKSIISCNFASSKPYVIGNDKNVPIKNVCLTNFKLDRTNTHTHGIIFNNIDGLTIDNIEIDADPNDTFPTGAGAICISSIDSYALNSCKNVRITNNLIKNGSNYGIQFGNASNIVVSDNNFIDCYREVIGIEPFSLNGQGAIVSNVTITGNTIETGQVTPNGTLTGLIIVTENSGGVVRNISIIGNTIREYGFNGSGNPGINIVGGADITVIGNIIRDLGGHGIRSAFVEGSQTSGHVNYGKVTRRVTIVGNTVRNCGLLYDPGNPSVTYSGIQLSDIKDSIISNNNIEGDKHYYGIEEIGTSEGNLFFGNRLNQNINNDIRTVNYGVGSTIFGNRVGTSKDISHNGTINSIDISNKGIKLSDRNSVRSLDLSVSVTGANSRVCGLVNTNDSTSNYSGVLVVTARQNNFNNSETASYILHVGKHNSITDTTSITPISANGRTLGIATSHPSFTFSLNTTSNQLEANPVGSTSGTFYFHIIAIGDIKLVA